MFRGLLLVNLVRQVLEGDPAKRLVKLREELRDREHDLEQLRAEIARLETRLAADTEGGATVTALREPLPPQDSPTAQSFWLWVLETLQLPAQRCGLDAYEFSVPADQREEFGGREAVRFGWDADAGADDGQAGTPAEVLALGSPLGDQLLDRLKRLGPVVHAAPRGQPVSIHELASALFAPYRVEGGSVRLSGCNLEDQPLLRYTYGVRARGRGRRLAAGTRLRLAPTAGDRGRLAGRAASERLDPHRGPATASARRENRRLAGSRRTADAATGGRPPRGFLAHDRDLVQTCQRQAAV